MTQIKCHKCGKFISNADYDNGKLKSETIWNWDKTEVEDVIYSCVQCSTQKAGDDE